MSRKTQRGSALLTVVALMAVLLMMILGLLLYAQTSGYWATQQRRSGDRSSCAMAGLQLARAYYGRSPGGSPVALWNSTYLLQAKSNIYNPFDPIAPALPTAAPWPTSPSTLMTNHPELFADLDGDGWYDVYIYVRDNSDEFPPSAPNPYLDNDQAVIVGAMCISKTMTPLSPVGTPNPSDLVAEALLQYNQQGGGNGVLGNNGIVNVN